MYTSLLRRNWIASILFVSAFSTTLNGADGDENERHERTLGVLIFPGFELLDASGPMEMWCNVGQKLKVVTVAAEAGQINSSQGPKIVAEFGFEDCPKLDLVLVPGGFGALKVTRHEPTLEWLRNRAKDSEIVMSVCNGATILAASGLLDGRRATTNKAYWKMSTAQGKNVDWVKQARWVDDGNIVTSSGVSAGMDMSLHVISRLYGDDTATRLANLTEYDWHRDPSWDPFAKLHGLISEQ